MPVTVNPDATLIPDQAEVWVALKSTVTSISSMIPATPSDDLSALGWSFCGLVDDKKGIPLDPSIEVREYDAFGHPQFRVKLKNGKLKTGFTALERNTVTKQIVLPGSTSNKIGAPKNVQIYVLYKFVDQDITNGTTCWVSLTAAPVELKGTSGIVEGEAFWADLTVHHTTDANNDIFQVVGTYSISKTYNIGTGTTAYTSTVDGQTTSSISTPTSAALQTALRALSNVGSTGVTVTGTGGAPGTLTAVFSVSVTSVTASGTGGTVTVS
jgi:hypothetical protein